jgi:hypothetical protein
MMFAAALAAYAIVTQDASALRAAPSENAAQQAQLWSGELVEVRGRRLEHLQVWDHRLERGGYVRATQVRMVDLTEDNAAALLAVVRFLRDTPGAESLGIAYVAAYLKAAPAAAIGPEPLDALGTMAERLARRASRPQGGAALSGQLDVAANYGVRFTSYEREGVMHLCYEGDAFWRVLTMASSPEQRARAALALTRHDCIDPALPPAERPALDRGRAELLERVDVDGLTGPLKNRMKLRRAGVWSAIAFDRMRHGGDAVAAGQRALAELAAIDRNELTDEDQAEYADAAMRVGASRWAAEPAIAAPGRLTLHAEAGEPGQTCVTLSDGKAALARRCSFGAIYMASAKARADGQALAVAVQPLATWRELWVFRRVAGIWTVDVLPPAAADSGVGYVEFAGFVPNTNRMLVAREARGENGRAKRSFEVVPLETLAAEKQAGSPTQLAAFTKWQDPAWKRVTVSLR